jgi:hemerythrin
VHKDLQLIIKKAVPFIEIINKETILETGHQFKEKINNIKRELMTQKGVGNLQGDLHIEEAEQDPEFHFKEEEKPDDMFDGVKHQNKLDQLVTKMKKGQSKKDDAIVDFEKNLGLRLNKLLEGDSKEDPQEEA